MMFHQRNYELCMQHRKLAAGSASAPLGQSCSYVPNQQMSAPPLATDVAASNIIGVKMRKNRRRPA
jgi:hypothetical protein